MEIFVECLIGGVEADVPGFGLAKLRIIGMSVPD